MECSHGSHSVAYSRYVAGVFVYEVTIYKKGVRYFGALRCQQCSLEWETSCVKELNCAKHVAHDAIGAHHFEAHCPAPRPTWAPRTSPAVLHPNSPLGTP